MNRHQTRYAFLAISLVIAPIAIAQGPAPYGDTYRDTYAYATPASPSMAEPLAPLGRDFGAEPQGQTIAPLNVPLDVLDGEPRDLRDMQPRTWCRNDPLTGKIPVECRHWSELASQDLSRLRSDA